MSATIITLMSGGEGAGLGAEAAGLRHICGVESNEAIADVARANGFGIITADIQDVDPAALQVPDVLHVSPECKNASNANHKGEEARLDVEIAECIVRYLEVMRPRVFTLENVYLYRRFQSFRLILSALNRLGYFTHFANLNAADFGVPQTRRRLILRAVRGGLVPTLPPAEPWVGWYEAIEDLIPSLPVSKFAPWQLERLPEALRDTTLFAQGGYDGDIVRVAGDDPSFAVTANQNQSGLRAFIVDGQNASNPSIRAEDDPAMTVVSNDHGTPRAWLSQGRVVKMTPRCAARFQSFPDSYALPDNNRLAYEIVGNACPPLMMQRVYEGLV